MKIKHFATASAIVLASLVGIFVTAKPTFAAFDADSECPHASLYWLKRIHEINYPETVKKINELSSGSDADKAQAVKLEEQWKAKAAKAYDGPEPKDAGDIKNVNDCNLQKTDYDAMDTLNIIINVVIGLVGFVAVIMIVIGGITFATSQGDPAKTEKGRKTLIFGIIGLVVSLLAFAIVNFVLKNVFA